MSELNPADKLYYLDFVGRFDDLPICSIFDCLHKAAYRCNDCAKVFCLKDGWAHREVKCK